MKLKTIEITLCEACLAGEGEECHTAGCAMWLHAVDLPFMEELYTVLSVREEYDDTETVTA